MNTPTGEKKDSRKKLRIIIGVVAIVAIIAIAVIWSQYQPTSSNYVEIEYKTVGWYHTYPSSDMKACLVLNLTITNKGYTDGVKIYPYNPLSLGGFGLTLSSITYDPTSIVLILNSSSLLGYSSVGSTLQSATLMNDGSETGTIIFEFSQQELHEPFTLQCSMTTTKYASVSVKISGS